MPDMLVMGLFVAFGLGMAVLMFGRMLAYDVDPSTTKARSVEKHRLVFVDSGREISVSDLGDEHLEDWYAAGKIQGLLEAMDDPAPWVTESSSLKQRRLLLIGQVLNNARNHWACSGIEMPSVALMRGDEIIHVFDGKS